MLNKILQNKQNEVKLLSTKGLKREKGILNPIISLKNRPFITEVKKASPTLGDINPKAEVVSQAKIYQKAGAGGVSVLTDEKFFKGSFNDLYEVSKNVDIPVLCKDFIISEIQIDIAYEMGADIILLIAKALDKENLKHLAKYAKNKGLFVLFEIHEIEEMQKLPEGFVDMVGVNSRNLETLQIDKDSAIQILNSVRGDFLKVAESGISSKEDVANLKRAGSNAFLIGSYLMQSHDPEMAIRELYEGLKCL